MARSVSLDEIDLALLRLVQVDAERPLHELGESVGLSGSAVQRRLQRLKQAGVIVSTVAVLDRAKVGSALTVVTFVTCERDGKEATRTLEESLVDIPEALDVYRITGDQDFVVVFVLPDMKRYQEIAEQVFATDPTVRRYRTHVVLTALAERRPVPL